MDGRLATAVGAADAEGFAEVEEGASDALAELLLAEPLQPTKMSDVNATARAEPEASLALRPV